MKINIQYTDSTSLVAQEVIQQARNLYGPNVQVHVGPDSSAPIDIIYFGIQQMITSDHLSILYDSDAYQHDLQKFRGQVLEKLQSILDQVIIDNETRVT